MVHREVRRREDATHQVLAAVPVGLPQGVSSHGLDVWLSNFNDGSVTEIDCASYMVAGTLAAGAGAFGICADGTNVWVANYFANSVKNHAGCSPSAFNDSLTGRG